MKKKGHTVDQIIKILRQVDEGCDIEIACREHNIAKATFHRWRRSYATHWATAEVTSKRSIIETSYYNRGLQNVQHRKV